jgi:hypothetical protein
MRRLALAGIALPVVMTASFFAPLLASADNVTPSHVWPGPRSAALVSPRMTALTGTRAFVSSASACDGAFDAISSPNGGGANYLFATAAISANDVWAVGISNVGKDSYERPLAEHWNGTSWSIVSTPDPGQFWADLNGVTAISSDDVWAVGDYRINSTGYVSSFAEHWNGISWSLVAMPQQMNFNYLYAVSADSSGDVWAAGASNSAGWFTLVEHWNGTSWALSPSLNHISNNGGFASNQLFGVSAFGPSDVWAVGSWQDQTSLVLQSLAEHWDGVAWTVITTPNESGYNEIAAVKALEAGHAVGVGYGSGQGEAWDMLATGTSTSSTETGPGLESVLEGIDRSGASVWAVGLTGSSGAFQSLAIPATWNSTTHTLTWGSPGTSANPSASNNVLFAVSAVSPYSYWAAGYATNSSGLDQTLTENYCALHFSLSAPTSTPSGLSFSMTLKAQTGSGAAVTGYLGTVHFTGSDPHATLPADYTFVPGDAGIHTFSGAALVTPCQQTITAADMVMPLTVPGTAAITVVLGACQAPAGTPAARGANQGTAGTPGGRTINQSGAGSPGPRPPMRGPLGQSDPSAAAVSAATSGAETPTAASAAQVVSGTAPQPGAHTVTAARSGTSVAPASAPASQVLSVVAQSRPASPPPPRTPSWLLLSLLVFLLALLGFRRRRSAS